MKKDFPDIDADFSDPGKVQNYIREKYGVENVANISNWSTLAPKVAVKDVARSIELLNDNSLTAKLANDITGTMPDVPTVEEAYSLSKPFKDYMDKYPKLYRGACSLQGLVRNKSVHAAGMVIGTKPLYELAPLRIDDDGTSLILEWDKKISEKFGFVKMDILGVATLTIMSNALKLIKQNKGIDLKIEDIPLDDQKVYEMLSEGQTSGVFQLESTMTPYCVKIKPKNIEDLAIITAIGRPSCPAESRELYMNRRLGTEKVEYEHSLLENALKDTLGVIIYEESMIYVVRDVAGWSWDLADSCRKISKNKGSDPELAERTKNQFIIDAMKHSKISAKEADEIFTRNILVFAGYGFNKAHAVSYSIISAQTAWLRYYYPTEFFCALLNGQDPNSDEAQFYIEECRKLGIEILPPDINRSKDVYTIKEDMKIITGLTAVKGVGDKALEEISNKQPFASITDFFARTDARVLNKRVIEALSKIGAFVSLGRTRKDMFTNYKKYRESVQAHMKKEKPLETLTLPEYTEEFEKNDILVAEKEILGRCISGNLSEVFSNYFKSSNMVTKLDTLDSLDDDKRIRVEVIINSKIKEFKIKQGKNIGRKFAKYSVQDVWQNRADITIWADQYEKYNSILKDGTPFKAICKVDSFMDKKALSLVEIESIFGNKIVK